jgi:phosphoribosylglycinamide formyltransferase 1
MMKETAQPPRVRPGQTIKLAALISGGGRTLLNLADGIDAGRLAAEVVSVVSSQADAAGVQRARDRGFDVAVIERARHKDVAAFSDAVWAQVESRGAELVCLAGFLSLLKLPDRWVNRVINIHPALLPSFGGKGMYGHHVHEAVLAAGCKVSGCTVHFCDQTYDTGPIIVQRACPVLEDDTAEALAARVFEQECLAYPEALRLIAAGRVALDGRRARILQA